MRIGLGILALVVMLTAFFFGDGWAAPSAPGGSVACARSLRHPVPLIEEALDPVAEHRLRERVLRLGFEHSRLDASRVGPLHDERLESTNRTAHRPRHLRPPRAALSASPSPSSH